MARAPVQAAPHGLDIAFFFAIDLSQGPTVASPFFIFFVFLVLSAAAKWGMRGVVLTALLVTLLHAAETAHAPIVANPFEKPSPARAC